MSNALTQPLSSLKGLGPKLSEKLAHIGLHTLQDLLFHLPYKYQDRTRVVPLHSVHPGLAGVIQGQITHSQVTTHKKRTLTVTLNDGYGTLHIRLFYFSKAQQNTLRRGQSIRAFGEVRIGPQGLEMIHPEYQVSDHGHFPELDQHLTPLYSTTEGIHQTKMRQLMEQALSILEQNALLPELIPESWLASLNLPSATQAIKILHQPTHYDDVRQLLAGTHLAQKRLALEELVSHHLSLQKIRAQQQQTGCAPIPNSTLLVPKLLKQLPFKLTQAQRKVCQEISDDLNKPIPMMRLVQGDVGSGKTLVALCAALQAIEQQFQVALLAPTELLAEQHHTTMTNLCEGFSIDIELLLGKTPKKARQLIHQKLENGTCQLLIGTHAIFQKSVHYHNLGLIIIDEQHRFGVQQRLALKEKAPTHNPHQLAMTATPIPRTLAMTAFADLDISIIDELPPGRSPVITSKICQSRRDQVIKRVDQACENNRQIYWVCTLIEESEELQAQAAQVTADFLKSQLPHRTIELLHGKLKPHEKSSLMNAFSRHEIEILVATTVIEVGVDVPNASIMIIENPERLGLAQLHQLRGRVGRGTVDSYCILLYQHPLSHQSRQKLDILRQTNDGFIVAEEDLKLRGPGEVLGTKQTGDISFRVAQIERDSDLLDWVYKLAQAIVEEQPQLIQPLLDRWLKNNDRFAHV